MNRRAVIKLSIDEFLKPLNLLRRDVRIEFNHDATIVGRFQHGNLRIGLRLDAGFGIAAGVACIDVFACRI